MNRPLRIVGVTVGLVAIGAVLGAIAGGVAVTIALILVAGPKGADVDAAAIAAMVGAALGAVTAPCIAWLLLRRVPLGRMFVGSVVGTIAGGIVGWFGAMADISSPVWTAFAGCLAAALVMRHKAETTETRALPPR